MKKSDIPTLLRHIKFRVSNLGFYDPQICRRKNKIYGTYDWYFSIKQESQDFEGYKVFFFEAFVPFRQFKLRFDKTINVYKDGRTVESTETPSNSTMLYAYATIAELLNTLLWGK